MKKTSGRIFNFLKICSKKITQNLLSTEKLRLLDLFCWSAENNYFERDKIKPVSSLKTDKNSNVLTANYINELLDSLPVSNNKEIRDKAILELMYSSGLRVK